MATVAEFIKGRRRSLGTAERQYVIKGATSETDALTALLAAVPTTVSTLTLARSECEVEEIAETAGSTFTYMGYARWGSGDGQEQTAGSFSISFDISGTAQRITQAITTRNNYKASWAQTRDFKGALNVNSDGTVEGTDTLIPTFQFVLNYTVDPADINDAYIATLRELIGTMNDATFKGFAAGELLFTKVSGSRRDEENWDLSFGFSVSKHAASLTVGEITGIEKRGWDYLWVYYVQVEDTTNKVIVKRPANCFVEQIYFDGDYTQLGLP